MKSTSRNNTPNEYAQPSVFRSRSIDSMSANEQNDSHSGGEGSQFDEKPPSSATFSKTFKLFRKRLSRTSNARKSDQTPRTSIQNDNASKSGGEDSAVKSGGDDSEGGSSGCEDNTPSQFNDLPSSNPDLATPETPTTAVPLGVQRSLPQERAPAIITSPPPPSAPPDFHEKNGSNASSYGENSILSKTWSPSTFTGEQLRGKCSLEYTEHMKDKSHKRKAHVVDLRKDDQQQIQQPPPPPNNLSSSSSKNAISTSFPSYYSYTLTLFNTKGALTYYFLLTNSFLFYRYSISQRPCCLRYSFYLCTPFL